MNTHFTYLLVDFGCLLFPFLFSFHTRIRFYLEWKQVWVPALVTASIFILWDVCFTHMGVWGFNPDYVCGIYLGNLPLEEILFFICIPYACVFTYFCIKNLSPIGKIKSQPWLVISLSLLLAVAGIMFYDRWYTCVTALSASAALLIQWYRKSPYMSTFFIAYILVLPFFFLSNGILTGSFLEAPVVWYDNAENLGIRMFTIPVEDTFYGMLMVLMNVAGYEFMKSRNS